MGNTLEVRKERITMDTGDKRIIIIDESYPKDSPRYRFFIYAIGVEWYLRVL